MSEISEQIRAATAIIPNFPIPGVSFVDITTVLRKPTINKLASMAVQNLFASEDYDVIVSPDARGWLLAQPIALRADKPLVLVRKPGKLPRNTVSYESTNEYSDSAPLEMHADDIPPSSRVLIVDDVLATCGTILAITRLVRNLGSEVVGAAALYDLPYVSGRVNPTCPTRAVVTYAEPPMSYLPPV